jgi:hypothetical protein
VLATLQVATLGEYLAAEVASEEELADLLAADVDVVVAAGAEAEAQLQGSCQPLQQRGVAVQQGQQCRRLLAGGAGGERGDVGAAASSLAAAVSSARVQQVLWGKDLAAPPQGATPAGWAAFEESLGRELLAALPAAAAANSRVGMRPGSPLHTRLLLRAVLEAAREVRLRQASCA